MGFHNLTFTKNRVKINLKEYDFVNLDGNDSVNVASNGEILPNEMALPFRDISGPVSSIQCYKSLMGIPYYPDKDFSFTPGATIELSGPYGTALVLLEITDGQQQPLTTQGPFVRVYDNATIFDRHTAIATKLGFKTCWEAAGAIDRIPKPT